MAVKSAEDYFTRLDNDPQFAHEMSERQRMLRKGWGSYLDIERVVPERS